MSIYNCRDFIKALRNKPENFYIIHYSCESLYDENEALSPRITSIAVTHFATSQTLNFSTHSIAEELHISREKVLACFNKVEKKLLGDFYTFVRDQREKFWVHWNMRNLTYGFEHLEHRYRVLGENNVPSIAIDRRLNLNDLLADRYGEDYAKDPKMKSLMELNGEIHRHFLSGKEEVEAFKNNEFIRMHNSTLCKVGFMHCIIRKLLTGKLKVASRGIGVALDRLFESRIAKAIGLIATLATIWLTLEKYIFD